MKFLLLATIAAVALAETYTRGDKDTGILCGESGGGRVDCGNGACTTVGDKTQRCICDEKYYNTDSSPCNYERASQVTAFFLAMFLGNCGVDYFYLARGNGTWICFGVLRLFTIGACGIWTLVDLARLAIGDWDKDGNDVPIHYSNARN